MKIAKKTYRLFMKLSKLVEPPPDIKVTQKFLSAKRKELNDT